MFSDPVVGEDFFGRQEIIDILVKRASALKSGYRQNVAIIGHQQLGKTSLLRHFLHVYRDPEILAIYVEIKIQALDYFIDQFVRSLLYQYLSQTEKTDPSESLAKLTERALGRIPKTVERIEEIAGLLKQRHAEEAYSKLFELTTIIRQETGKNCIVILDEFHRLGEFGIRNAFSDFGKRIMVQKDTMYLLASSSFSASRKILAEKLSLLFGNFERIYLEPFRFETAFEFLEKKLSQVAMPETLKHFVVALTDGHPFLLDVITRRAKELCAAKAETVMSRATVSETLLKLLYDSQGVLNQFFLKLISPWTQSSARGTHILILVELAKGKNKLKDLSAAVNRNQKETSRQIQELMDRELILKTGVFYRFHNRIFKFWLKEVYEKKELFVLGAGTGAEGFLACIDAMIAETEELLKMDVSDRLMELFRRFNNDIVEFGEKRRKLPHFTEMVKADSAPLLAGEPPRRELVAKGRGRCWVCRIVEEKATEKEVLGLVQGAPRHHRGAGVPTRVLVALKGMEENAKLLAKEKRILTLGLSRVNLLMDLYGKSPIVCMDPATRPAE
jgi:AAA+ ATPase superfamily predicted ATPase